MPDENEFETAPVENPPVENPPAPVRSRGARGNGDAAAAAAERSAPFSTAERLTTDGPLTNAEVRGAGSALPRALAENDELADHHMSVEERLRAVTLAEAGQEPDFIEHHSNVAAPVGADAAPGAFFGMGGTYILGQRDIFASSIGQQITSYTMDAAAVSADGNGDKIVNEGTVLQASGTNKVAPRTSGAAVGVSSMRVNLRLGDTDVGMVLGGRLRSDKLWDNGVFGTVAGSAVTQLAALGIYLTPYDV